MTSRDLQRKSPDAAANGSGQGQGDVTSMPIPTLHPIEERPDLDAVKRMRMELGTKPIEYLDDGPIADQIDCDRCRRGAAA
jgi:hypothetical protein